MIRFRKISNKEIIDYSRVLSLLLLSRISIIQSLDLIGKQTKNKELKEVNKKILLDIKSGVSLSKSFSRYPALFSEVFIANLKVAEETGQIAEVLNDYTEYLEKMYNLKRKIIQAIRYPVFVLMVAFAVIIFMFLFIIPTFENLFTSFKADLPELTKYLLIISNLLVEHSVAILVFIGILSVTVFLILNNNKRKQRVMDFFIWRIPIISGVYIKNLTARFALSMGILLKSRVGLVDALKISRNISSSPVFKEQIDNLIKRIIKGESLSANIKNNKLFDPTFSRLLAVGEESAELDKVFYTMSNYYNSEFDYQLDNITSMLEPVLILFIGAFVAVILVALYLPMFEIINHFGV